MFIRLARGRLRYRMIFAAIFPLVFALLGLAAAVRPAVAIPQKPTTARSDCTSGDCHAALLKHKVLHGPLAAGECAVCHKYDDPAQHRFIRLSPPNEGCTGCHDIKSKAVSHQPVREGRCTACHDPHGSDNPKMLLADPAGGLCQLCHKSDEAAKKKYVHAPFAQGACGSCHESHSSAEQHLLKQAPGKLCTGCHTDMAPLPGQAFSMHAPAKDDCMACHDAHASNVKGELKQAAPDLCLSCHKDVKETMASVSVKHGAMTQEGTCMNCHVAHYSKLAKLQKQTQPQECLSCHNRPMKAADGRTLTDMEALLSANPEQHGPIRLGACSACHQPHGGKETNLLTAAYPPEFYSPFKEDLYKLCFTCHSPDLVLQSQSAPTGFADGTKNLHWVHVDQEKGRTCRACHEVHASKQPFHMRESVPFGSNGWTLAIRFRQTATGGTCSPECHAPRTYDHGNRARSIPFAALTPKAQALVKAELPAPATAPAKVVAGDSYPVAPPPFTPGVFPCTGCHDPAQSVNTEKRVLHKPHEDIQLQHDEEHRWCLDCHNAQNRDVLRSASGEPIPFAESYRLCGQCHGLQYRDWKAGVHGKRTGEWDGSKTYLLCVNCHNPHSPKFKPLKPLPPPVRPDQPK